MKKPWFLLGMAAAGLFLMNALKKSASAQTPEAPNATSEPSGASGDFPVIVVYWEPGASTQYYDAEGSARDHALATIGFPYRSIKLDGWAEWLEIEAPVQAIEGVIGMMKMSEGVSDAWSEV